MTTKKERAECIQRLKEWLKPGDTVYTILRHVSRSGMSRRISVIIPDKTRPGEFLFLDGNVADALGWGLSRKPGEEGVKVSGCGMDMGFHLVYVLSQTLWGEEFQCTGESCPANDHSNSPYPAKDGEMFHKSGGYALKQRWL